MSSRGQFCSAGRWTQQECNDGGAYHLLRAHCSKHLARIISSNSHNSSEVGDVIVAILQLRNLGLVKLGTSPEVTQSGSGGATVEAHAAQRESLHGDGCPGPGQGCASTRRMGHRPSWHRSTEALQTHASQLCGSRMNGTIPELRELVA